MAQLVSALKIGQIAPDATEMKLSIVRLTLPSPMSSEEMTGDVVRRAMEKEGVPRPGVKFVLYFKDEEGDFVTLPNMKIAWPAGCISDSVLKVWFACVPDPPGTLPSTPVFACLGPHVHMPDKKKAQTLDYDLFKGYSFLAAAGDGCASCVEYWLENGADLHFESSSRGYTAMDCVEWAEKTSQVSSASAKQVKLVLYKALVVACLRQHAND